MKDIAVVGGQTARFECIVQGDPTTVVFWMKNNEILEDSAKTIIEFRNGVCRLTIPQAYQSMKKLIYLLARITLPYNLSDDGGTYECIAQNQLGTDSTNAVLIIPGDQRGLRNL